MNVVTTLERPRPVKLTVEDFLLLKRGDAFAGFSKVELIDGELTGIPVQGEDEPETDASVPFKLCIADYERLDRAGAFAKFTKTELIDGVVYWMSPQYRLHGFTKDELAYRLRRALEARTSALSVATEQSVEFQPHSEPQPDIILTSEPRGPGAIPGKSIALIVEVAFSTADFDLNEKAHVYASAGVAEYWVEDANGRVIHQMWSPGPDGYAERREVAFGERIEAVTIEGLAVETAGV